MNKKSLLVLSSFVLLFFTIAGEILYLNAVDKDQQKSLSAKNHFMQLTNNINLFYALKEHTIKLF
jgi:hypothetical protein